MRLYPSCRACFDEFRFIGMTRLVISQSVIDTTQLSMTSDREREPSGMRVLLLGCGLQGRAVLHDLARSTEVAAATCADLALDLAKTAIQRYGRPDFVAAAVDAADPSSLGELIARGFDVIIDMLPREFVRPVAEAAIAGRTSLVNTYYDQELRPLAAPIEAAQIS